MIEEKEPKAPEAKLALFGRHEIHTAVSQITRNNLLMVLNKAIAVHHMNAAEIDYLYKYMKGEQPILHRTKDIRPEICNRIVENHASEIAQFTSGYFMGEPVTYVRRGDREEAGKEVDKLNTYMWYEDKASHDKNLATWMAVCGVAYRMVLPDGGEAEEDESPFELDVPDPRNTFVVYSTGFGHKRVMGAREIFHEESDGSIRTTYAVYTPDTYYEVENGAITVEKAHSLGDVPIYEYRLNLPMMGAFEPAIPLLDAINSIQSNRADGVEQFVQSFLKFKNCEIEESDVERIHQMGAIIIKSTQQGMDSDVEIVSQELNQQQTQTLVDYLYDQVLVICGMPSTKKGGTSTSDTGAAVMLRDGWQQCEARARDTERLFEKSERMFLKLVLRIIRATVADFDLSLSEVECKFTRRQHDNLLTKTQSLLHMLEAGLAPEVAIATSGLFNDPMDVAEQSAEYLKKWEHKEMVSDDDDTTVHTGGWGYNRRYGVNNYA